MVRKIIMNKNDTVTVRILDLPSAGGGCACSDLSRTPQYAAMVQQKVAELTAALQTHHPGRARVEYVDLRAAPEEKASQLGQLLVQRKYPTPLVVIGGEAKFAGSILVPKILKEVGHVLDS
jgi:disulfide oxidoreductase YuzD